MLSPVSSSAALARRFPESPKPGYRAEIVFSCAQVETIVALSRTLRHGMFGERNRSPIAGAAKGGLGASKRGGF